MIVSYHFVGLSSLRGSGLPYDVTSLVDLRGVVDILVCSPGVCWLLGQTNCQVCYLLGWKPYIFLNSLVTLLLPHNS